MFSQNIAEKEYIKRYFGKKPEKEWLWKYSPRDLVDEFVIWLVLVAVAAGVGGYCFGHGLDYKWFWTVIAALPALIYGGYVVYLYFIKRVFVKYELTPEFFTITDGFFTRRNVTTQVMDIIQINTTQTLWERIIGVGTLILVIQEHDGIKQKTVVIRGIAKYQEMRDNIEYYRSYYRLVRAHAVINA